MFNDLNWLENKDEPLKLYDKIIKEEFTGTVNKKVISSKIFKDFIEDIVEILTIIVKKEIYKKRLYNVENNLTKSKKSKNVNQLKNYLKKIKDLTGIKDLKLMKRDLLKIKKEKDTLIYVFFCLKCLLIIIQKN